MAVTDSSCQILYGVREVHFRPLNVDGSVNESADWVATDCPVEVSIEPEIEEGASTILKCGDRVKNIMRADDQLTGITISFSMGCRNPEIEYIIAGSVGNIIYDSSSPPVAIGYEPPTLEEQEDAVPFEMRIYQAHLEGSNEAGFCQIHVYQCLPAFVTAGSSQEEYATQEWEIAAVENSNYDGPRPVYTWEIVSSIPS